MDRMRWALAAASVLVLGLAGLAVVLAVLVPFDVTRPATVQAVSGDVTLLAPHKLPVSLNDDQRDWQPAVQAGQSIRVPPDGSAALTFALNGGRALLTGPAELRVAASYRRATALGHILDSARYTRRYVLTLEQSLGTVRYLFDQADPPLDQTTLTIRLPDRDYVPTSPCWQIDVQPDGSTQAGAIACP